MLIEFIHNCIFAKIKTEKTFYIIPFILKAVYLFKQLFLFIYFNAVLRRDTAVNNLPDFKNAVIVEGTVPIGTVPLIM